MLLGTEQKLAEIIIELFRRYPQLGEAEIHEKVVLIKPVTHRAIFKELSKLVHQGILVRVKGRYSIKVTWILELLQLGDDLTKQTLNKKSLDLQIPKPGERIKWRFRDIRRMDTFWVQLMFVLFSISSTKKMHVWCPHFWFHLLDFGKELQAMGAMKKGNNKHFLIIGSDSYIDKLPTRYWNKEVYEWSYAQGPFEGENRRYLDIIDDFVLTVLFQADFTKELDLICKNINNERDLYTYDLKSFFDKPSLTTLTLEHNPQKAKKLRKKFVDFFGH